MAGTQAADIGLKSLQFSMRSIPEAERVEVWREQFGRALLRVDIEPVTDQPPHAQATLRALPGFRMIACAGSTMHYQRTPDLVADGDDSIGLVVNLGRKAAVSHCDKAVVLGSGDAVTIFSHKPANLVATRHVGMLFPRAAIAARVGDIDKAAARYVSRQNEALRLLKTYIRSFDGTLANLQLRDVVINHVHDLAALALDPDRVEGRQSAVAAARLSGALELIAQRFDEPEITSAAIAKQLNISPRYLQRLIEPTGRSFTARVNELRLLRAFALLTQAQNDKRRISDIALQVGFSDISHFNRLFRARFGDTPTGLRGWR